MRKGWTIKKLGEVLQKTETINPTKKPESNFKYVDVSSVNNEGFFIENTTLIKGRNAPSRARKSIKTNDVIFATVRPTLKRIAIVPKELNNEVCSTGYFVLRPKETINYKWLFYFLQGDTFISKIEKLQRGASYPAVTDNDIKEQLIVFPTSISEQKHIITILDHAFSAIDKAKANIEKNLHNTKALFESYLQKVFEKKGEDWEVKKIGEICDLMTGGTPSSRKPEYYENGKINWLVSGDVNLEEINECEGRITELGMANSNAKYLPINSIIIALNGQGKTRGSVAMLRIKATCNQSLVSIYPKNIKTITPDYIFYNLKVRYQEIRKITGDSGNDRRGLNMPLIRNIAIPFPRSVNEQIRLVKKFSAFLIKSKEISANYQKKINSLEELKKNMLQKAFSEELTDEVYLPVAITLPTEKSSIASTDLQAAIISIALQQHIKKSKESTFHHVKAEKIVNMVQYHLQVKLDRKPVKDAAGPNDFPYAKKVESRAAKAGFFTVRKINGVYHYSIGRQAEKLISKVKTALPEKYNSIVELIDLMVPMNTQQAEIVATVYAAWNNLLIDDLSPDDEAIVYEARENWHKDKINIPRDKFFKALDWMKQKQIIPEGTGEKVLSKSA